MKRLIIFDVSSFIFRAFFAIRPLHAPDGTPVNSVYGVLNMMIKILRDYNPTHVLIARDVKGGSFRNELYPEYKANRSEPPEDLIPQFALIEELIDLMNWPQIKIENYEADDIIGSAAVQYYDHFDEIMIATGDKDIMQFVNDKVKILDTMKDKLYARNDVKVKMGVWPEQIVDYLSLLGDSSDNIPGVKGIGAKGAQGLLEEYESLDAIIDNIEDIKNKRAKTALEKGLDQAELSKSLVKIVTDLNLGKTVEDIELHFQAKEELLDFLKRLGFNSSIKKLQEFVDNGNAVKDRSNIEFKSIEIKDLEKLKFNNKKPVFIYHSLKNEEEYLTLNYDEINYVLKASFEESQKIIKELLEKKLHLVFWDAKAILKLSKKPDFKVNASIDDLSLMHFLIDPSLKHTLEFASQEYFGTLLDSEPDTEAKHAEWIASCAALYNALKNKLDALDLLKVYQEIDLPLVTLLARMELRGVTLNAEFYADLEVDFSAELDEIEQEIEKSAGEKINLRSPKQLSELLFDRLGMPIIKKTKTGASTDSEVMQELVKRDLGPIPELILKYRELDKLLSTYIKTLPKLIEADGRIHTTFQQTNAATGRLSSDHPNLQNIPVRTQNGRKLRKGFIAPEGRVLVSADYSQVELRLLAHCSQDKTMLDAFKNNKDIHAQTAAEIFHINLNDVSSEQRSAAKAINFGLMYGQSSFGLSKTLGISRSEAKEYITHYFEKFSSVKSYLDSLIEDCEQNGYAITLFGRKRFLPDIKSSNRTVKSMAERVAINSPIQGSAADIIKMAMVKVENRIQEQGLDAMLVLQVHDELIVECAIDESEKVAKILKEEMEGSVNLSIPLSVEVGSGQNWFDLK